MKRKCTRKDVRLFKNVFQCGYCTLDAIFQWKDPSYYNCGVYGWNFDVYTDWDYDIAITTGYRNTIGKKIPKELIDKYSESAKNILNEWELFTDYESIREKLAVNRNNFFKELLAL